MPVKLHRIVDPLHVYPIYAIEVLAEDADQARQLALEAMMGCPVDDVDENVVKESLAALMVEECRNAAGTCRMREDYRNPTIQVRLLETGTREEIIGWLMWNDANGVWSDEDSEAEGWQPITLEGARSAMRKALSESVDT